MRNIRPPALRRSWLFVGGVDREALQSAATSGADVIIQEFEDFTPPHLRPEARQLCKGLMSLWKGAGCVAAVRVNPLAGDGLTDLAAVMRSAPDIVLLPKVTGPDHIIELDQAISRLETEYGLNAGSTEIVPNVESARGLRHTFDICRSSPRITGCLVASEDMAADLGAERSQDGEELRYIRSHFLIDCVAANIMAIDYPYTWTDEDGLISETQKARSLGYAAKSLVKNEHATIINDILSPSPNDVSKAQTIVEAFEAAQKAGDGRAIVDGSMVETPIYTNALRLLARAHELSQVD
jgi:citrate lyase subunit beta/citryl-CoA lyase